MTKFLAWIRILSIVTPWITLTWLRRSRRIPLNVHYSILDLTPDLPTNYWNPWEIRLRSKSTESFCYFIRLPVHEMILNRIIESLRCKYIYHISIRIEYILWNVHAINTKHYLTHNINLITIVLTLQQMQQLIYSHFITTVNQ